MRLKPTPEYLTAKKALELNARVALRIVVAGIEADPHHLVRRHRRPQDGVIVDYSAEGLFVSYRILNAWVELLEVIDLKKAHRW